MLELKIQIDSKAIDELIKKYPEISGKVCISKMTEATLLLERAVRTRTPEGAGPMHLRDTIFQEVQRWDEETIGMVGTPCLYGEPVEYGTRPHWPPQDAIEYWVNTKLGITGTMGKSIAFLIARKIAAKGTEGAHMFEKGAAESKAEITRILNEIPAEIVRCLE